MVEADSTFLASIWARWARVADKQIVPVPSSRPDNLELGGAYSFTAGFGFASNNIRLD